MAQPMIVDDYAAIARRMEELRGNKAIPSFTLPPGCVIILQSNLGYAEKSGNDLILVLNDEGWTLHAHRVRDVELLKKVSAHVKYFFPSATSAAGRPLVYLSPADGRRLRQWVLSNLAHY